MDIPKLVGKDLSLALPCQKVIQKDRRFCPKQCRSLALVSLKYCRSFSPRSKN